MKHLRNIVIDDLKRTANEIHSLGELEARLARKNPLRIKYGVDVTAPFLHIGHAVNLWLMRYFQERGHKVIFLIGDFTTQIGDPTGKMETRGKIPPKEIEKNAKDFIEQVSRVLMTDRRVFEVRRNSEWYGKMRVSEFLPLLGMVTHAKLIQRDMFQKRIEGRREIYMHEMVYPILQGYDSVMLKSDLTIVGTDQLFNELMGRYFQEKFLQKPQVVVTTKITPGLDGVEKQSKSLGNYIAIDDAPHDMFGKVMSLPDALVVPYLEIYTDVPLDDVRAIEQDVREGKLHPMEAKKRLAASIVSRYYGVKKAEEAEKEFAKVFQKKEMPQQSVEKEFVLTKNEQACRTYAMADFVRDATGCLLSKTETKRLIEQSAVTVDGVVLTTRWSDPIPYVRIKDNSVLRVGKNRFYRIRKPK